MKTRWTRRWSLGLLLAATVVCAAAVPTDADKIKLRLNLDEGDVFRFKVVIDQVINQEVMGQAQNMTQRIGMGQRFEVLAAREAAYDVKVTYDWVLYRQDGPMGLIEYDSDNPPETPHPATLGFASLKGQYITMTMDPLGRVLDLGGVDAMLAAMMARFDSLGMGTPPGLEESLQQQFGDEAMKTQMENMMAIYPEEEVGVGDTWVREVSIVAGMPMNLTNTYRLLALDGEQVEVAVDSVVEPGDGEPMEMGGMQLDYAVSGTQEGTMWLDRASGLPMKAELTQQIAGEVTMNSSMTWPIEIETTNVMEVER